MDEPIHIFIDLIVIDKKNENLKPYREWPFITFWIDFYDDKIPLEIKPNENLRFPVRNEKLSLDISRDEHYGIFIKIHCPLYYYNGQKNLVSLNLLSPHFCPW